jgi:hypothetical protein
MTTPIAPATSPTPPPTPPAGPAGTPRWVWMLLMLLTASLIGVGAGVLAHAGGADVPDAIFKGGAAFAGTTLLLIAIAHYVSRGR